MARLFKRQAKEREQRDELLSAYLDGQLSAGERARLEAQLATDPALRAELEALRHTVALVRDLPPVPIPRNFILPPAVAARRRPVPSARPRRLWAAPLLTAATAVVSLLFVVVLAGDLLLSSVGGLALAPAAAPPKEVPQVVLEPSPIVETEAEKAMRSGAMPTATVPPMPTEAPLEVPPAATAGAERYEAETPEGVEPPAPVMPVPTAVPTVAAEAAAAPTALAVATESAEVAPSMVEEEERAAAAEGERGMQENETARLAPISPWRVLEVVLGLTTLGLALTTVRAWRARRR